MIIFPSKRQKMTIIYYKRQDKKKNDFFLFDSRKVTKVTYPVECHS